MRRAIPITLTADERTTLERWARGRRTPVRLVLRAKIVLQAAAGLMNKDIAQQLSTDRECVGRWRTRFAAHRVAGLERDAPRAGRTPRIRPHTIRRIVTLTTTSTPPAATHWTTRTLAPVVGVSPKTIHRVWQAHGLTPHRTRTFKLSRDPQFVEKLTDVVGLYLNPPDQALVFCADEKSQIQALDRTQPGLPLKKGRCGTLTHDYKRHGTTTLFAALNVLTGEVLGTCQPRHRHQEWIQFLKRLDRETPPDRPLHLIVDNYATHKHPAVRRWVQRHPRIHVHFIPTSSSWLNLIERWFRDLTTRRLRRGVFRHVMELIAAIEQYIAHHNTRPHVFTWVAQVEEILAKIGRAQKALHKTVSV
jgi:transposase